MACRSRAAKPIVVVRECNSSGAFVGVRRHGFDNIIGAGSRAEAPPGAPRPAEAPVPRSISLGRCILPSRLLTGLFVPLAAAAVPVSSPCHSSVSARSSCSSWQIEPPGPGGPAHFPLRHVLEAAALDTSQHFFMVPCGSPASPGKFFEARAKRSAEVSLAFMSRVQALLSCQDRTRPARQVFLGCGDDGFGWIERRAFA
jgi:hypothetical protein